ncbi:MAG: glycosyltransferase [Candidatus Omnitrophota bacterium]
MQITPFVSVIVPVRNAERTLDKTFEYLLNIDYPRRNMEILIADGGSTDKTIAVIEKWQKEYPFIQLVEIPNCPSPGYARNKALDVVKGDFIFFTDGDCAPCKKWITEILRHFQNDPKIGIVGGEIYTLRVDPDNLTELYCEHFRFNMVAPRYGFIGEGYFPPLFDYYPTQIAGHRAFFFVTANAAYRKEAIDKTKARFWSDPTGEDIEFGLKVQKDGWKLYFAPQARVDHMHRADFKALKKVWVTYGIAHGPLISTYAAGQMEIILQFLQKMPIIKFRFPIKGFIYLGNFQLMNLFIIATIIGIFGIMLGGIERWGIYTLLTFLLGIYFTRRFFDTCFHMLPHKHFFTWCKMKYMTNLCFSIGGLKNIKKYKVFCIEPSF